MKKLLATAILSSLASVSYAETYQFLGGLGYSESDADNAEGVTTLDGTYYFAGQDTVGPLDQFAYLDDTSNVRADIESGDADIYSIGGSYFGERFGVGLDYFDNDDADSEIRLHGDFFFMENFKGILGYSMPDEGDDVVDLALQYDQSINDTDYIGYTVKYIDTDDATISFDMKYLNAFDNGQFLVVEANVGDYEDSTGYGLSGKWYLNKKTGFLLGYSSVEAGDDDATSLDLGLTHFFTQHFAVDLTYAMKERGDSEEDVIGIRAELQL